MSVNRALRSLGPVLALLAAIPCAPAHGAEPDAGYDAAAWRSDFDQIKAELERSYVNLAWMGSPQSGIDVPRLERRTQAALATATTDAEARRALQDFVKGFRDGHLSEQTYLVKPATPVWPEPPAAVIDPRDSASGCAALGYASTSSIRFSLPFETLPGFTLLADGITRPFRTGLVAAPNATRIGVIRIHSFEQTAFPAVCLAAWAKIASSGQPVTAAAIEGITDDIWYGTLAAALAELRAQGAKAVIVDVGMNSGGNDSGDWSVRLFTDRPVDSSRMMMVAAPVSGGYFDEQIGEMTKGLAKAPKPEGRSALEQAQQFFMRQKASIPPKRCDLSWVWREQRPWRLDACNGLIDAGFADGFKSRLPRNAYGDADVAQRLSWAASVDGFAGAWRGPAYVLTDAQTYSSAEMFAATMRDNQVARTIGVRTGGDGCGFMTKGAPLVLAHARLRFRIPNCIRLRADGTDEVAGIAPDFPLPPTEGESPRARAARVIGTLEQDLIRAAPPAQITSSAH
ncbi:MAG: S41 family peptidase [Pseudomonadota bacterium]|uniref:S41 family peptidase n=1 Tax=Sphingomonas sp. ERG5 TaxID=1381597 RepID=UPI00054B0995|nr:S41 family peptidase [Sphingomonas sp. ERG5]